MKDSIICVKKNLNLSCPKEKEATAKQAFTFPGTIPTETEVARSATEDA